MGVVSVFRDVAFVLIPKAVGPLQYRGLTGHPERAPQPGIAVLRNPALNTKHARLDGCEVHAAELQELSMLPNASLPATQSWKPFAVSDAIRYNNQTAPAR